jgi:pimeloyl-ACP methyl ester carboxylesterase
MQGLKGELHEFTRSPAPLQCFESGALGSKKLVVFMGGLTDGLLACPYIRSLSAECAAEGYALIQPVFRSSYCQFGTGTLDRDVEDLTNLLFWAQSNRQSDIQVSLIGHSTGCQISVFFCQTAPQAVRQLVKSVILQSPVSDREAFGLEHDKDFVSNLLQKARSCENSSEIVHTLYGIAPLTATRTLHLFEKYGLDDMFSSDLTDEELRERLGHMDDFYCLFVIALGDQYVPPNVYPDFCTRLISAVHGSTLFTIEGADHSLHKPKDIATAAFVSRAVEFMKEGFLN